ncbi:MAG: hypothetical protein JO242_01240 [Streptosporangiaceae bacterium]|nr:hypothetical protein [Streptosporangiaceae bacterium]
MAVIAVGVAAIAGPAAASAAPSAPAAHPEVWVDTGQRFMALTDCKTQGDYDVYIGEAITYNCWMNDYYDLWELNIYIS